MTSVKFGIAGREPGKGRASRSVTAVAGHETLTRVLPAATFAVVLVLAWLMVRMVDDGIPAPVAVMIGSVPALLAARGTLLLSMLLDRRPGE